MSPTKRAMPEPDTANIAPRRALDAITTPLSPRIVAEKNPAPAAIPRLNPVKNTGNIAAAAAEAAPLIRAKPAALDAAKPANAVADDAAKPAIALPAVAANDATDADAASIDEPIVLASLSVAGIASAKLLPTPVTVPISIVSGDKANAAALPIPANPNEVTCSEMPSPTIAPPTATAATANCANAATASLLSVASFVSPSMNPVMNGNAPARAGATASVMAIAIRCIAASTLPNEPARPDITNLYFSPTGRADAIASRILVNPSTPSEARIDAARMASAPKMRRKMSSFAVWSSPPIACVSVPMISTIGFICPSAPRNEATESPSWSRAPTASSAGAISRISIVLTLVPASLPFTPLLARIASVADKSSMLCPARPATADDIENASDI